MKNLGMADIILNIKLLREDDCGITMVQSHNVEKMLSRFGYSDCKLVRMSYDSSVLLRKNQGATRNQ
jgi:hypothetical protein